MAYLVTVGGVPLPTPSKFVAGEATIVDAGRNAQGVMIGSIIRDGVENIQIEWRYLTFEQWSQIIRLFRRSSSGQFINNVTFLSQDGAHKTKEMYVSDRTAELPWYDLPDHQAGWVSCSLSLIEV